MISWSMLLLALAAGRHAALPSWHLRHVALRIAIAPSVQRIDGVARLVVASAPATPLLLDLGDSLTVDSARATGPTGASVAGTREPGHVRFAIAAARAGDLYRVAVWYHGSPIHRAVAFDGTAPAYRVASYGLPHSAREWWPVLDEPDQKADSADLWITAPAPLVAVSNGRLVTRTVTPDGSTATAHWAERYPVYPDAISLAVGDYRVTRSSVAVGNRQLPFESYLFPEDSARGAVEFAPVPAMLQFVAGRLGPYPFAGEKYALVEFVRPSFREGETLSHIGANLLTGKGDAEQVIAHEIAHQWFGNSVTVRRWQEIWLNESLAEYTAWQWIRHAHGEAAYQNLLDSAIVAPLSAPIVPANPADFKTLFGNATFERGPAVLVLLERRIGAPAFATAVRRYVAAHAHGWAETIDFQRACEAASGTSLAEFFGQFVYGTAPLMAVDLHGI